MPIKFGKIDSQLFIEDNGEYKPLGYVSDVELPAETNKCSDEYLTYFKPDPIEIEAKITSNIRAWVIFIKTGNDLYLKFPKKLRRRKRL